MEHSGLVFGTAYSIEGLSLTEIREDLANMAAAGINLLRIGEDLWPSWEPEEGEYDFQGFQQVLMLCREQGLNVLLTIPSQICPQWLRGKREQIWRGHNDGLIRRLAELVPTISCVRGFQVDATGNQEELALHQCRLLKKCLGEDTQVLALMDKGSADAYWEEANRFSVLGCRVYHEAGLKNSGAELTFRGDMARGNRETPYLVLETQCQGRLGQLPYPGQLRLWAFHHIASGSAGLCYRSWHSDWAPGTDWKGVVGYDGKPGRAYREVSGIGAELKTLGDKLYGLRKQNRVAVVASAASARQMPKVGGKTYADCLRWICDSFYRLNIELDLVPDSCRDFSEYALVVTPCLYSAEDPLITALRNYVAEGGCLISTFRSFFTDGAGNIRRGAQPYGMTDLFGMYYEDFTVPEETCLPEYMAEVSDFMEILEPEEAVSLAIYDSPAWRGKSAASCCRFGKGQAAYFGCYSEEGFEPILLRLLAMWHIPVPETAWPVVQKRAISREGKPLTFLLHYSPACRVIPSPATGTELFSGRHMDEGEPLELKGWDVKILEGDL